MEKKYNENEIEWTMSESTNESQRSSECMSKRNVSQLYVSKNGSIYYHIHITRSSKVCYYSP